MLHPLEPVEAVLRDRLLEEVDAQYGAISRASSIAVSGSWNQYESTPISIFGPTCSRTVRTTSTSSATSRPRRTFTPAKPSAMHWSK